ncbi:hypothetical protein MAP00_002717 [Monascus purpureus]|nr:hypothetical protein MAP00_002717 [Monascus purpureus]
MAKTDEGAAETEWCLEGADESVKAHAEAYPPGYPGSGVFRRRHPADQIALKAHNAVSCWS